MSLFYTELSYFFRQRAETDGAAILVDFLGIFKQPRTHLSVLIPIELSPVTLRSPLEETYPVFKIRRMSRLGFPFGNRLFQNRPASALNLRLTDGMLQNKPSG